MEANTAYNADYVPPPGFTLAEALSERGLAEEALAQRTGTTLAYVQAVMEGEAAITPEFAEGLRSTTGIPAQLWMTMDQHYQDHVAQHGRNAG